MGWLVVALAGRAAAAQSGDAAPTALTAPTAREAGSFETVAPATGTLTDDGLRIQLQAGGSLSTGNAQSLNANAAGRLEYRRGHHRLTVDGAFNYGVTWRALDMMNPTGPREAVVGTDNSILRARYDFIFAEENSLYLSALWFRDIPAGFFTRLSAQLGYTRNIVRQPELRRFWFEIGADLTGEYRIPPMMAAPDQFDTRLAPFGRVFIGYDEKANRAFNVRVGLEGLLNLINPSDFRFNGSVTLATRLSDAFSLGVTFNANLLTSPVTNHYPLDTSTVVNLIYVLVPRPTVVITPAPAVAARPAAATAAAHAPATGAPAPAAPATTTAPATNAAPATSAPATSAPATSAPPAASGTAPATNAAPAASAPASNPPAATTATATATAPAPAPAPQR